MGLNKFVIPEEEDSLAGDIFETDPEVEGVQKKKLAAVKFGRDGNRVQQALRELGEATDRNENLMPHIIEAVKSYTTVGEICDVMREKWGEFRPPNYI